MSSPATAAQVQPQPGERSVVLIHGRGGSFKAMQAGLTFTPLSTALLNTYGANYLVFPYYQDEGYRDPSGNCINMPPPNTSTGDLYADPNAIDPTICDGISALAYDAAGLDAFLSTSNGGGPIQGPVALISDSLGGNVVRGWMALAQELPGDTTLQIVDTSIFLQGTQEGSYLLNYGRIADAAAQGDGTFTSALLTASFRKFVLDYHRPGLQDDIPRSRWLQSVNVKPVPPNLHYYNFYSDITVKLDTLCFIWVCGSTTDHYGDTVAMPGDPNPAALPKDGGAQFLPGGTPTVDRHQFLIAHTHEAIVTGDPGAYAGAYASQVADVVNDPASHLNYVTQLDNPANSIETCTAAGGRQRSLAKVLTLLTNPAGGCQ